MTTKTKAEKFPLSVKNGSSIVKIYEDRKPGGTYYRVVFHLGGKRQRLNFSDLDSAKTEAAAKAAQLARGDVDALQLTGRDRLTYGRALDAVKPFGVPLDAVAIEYAEARKVLGGFSLIESARFYMKHHGKGILGKSVADAAEEFRQAKKDAGRSDLYLKDIAYRLRGLIKAFHCEVRQLTPQDVSDFLDGLKAAPRSFNNHALLLKTFFRYCQGRGWLAKDTDLLGGVERRKDTRGDIEIFTPAELRLLLSVAKPRVATCIAIQAFAGVRTEELFRLKWSDLERRSGNIEISAKNAKTASRRLIPIPENLAAWLRQRSKVNEKLKTDDAIWPVVGSEYFERLAATAAAAEERLKLEAGKAGAEFKWKKNALRHSFISYRVALTKDIAAVSLEAGNSPKMIFQNYRELCTEAEAKDWFGIVPAEEADGKIVGMVA